MSQLRVEICKVLDVVNHPNADKLDVITIKGWNCIVSKGQFKIGDLVIFCPPDSLIPDNIIEQYKLEFLKKNNKVGTIKLRGAVSQGLILDLACLPANFNIIEGRDVAEVLKITKWEPPEQNIGGTPPKENYRTLLLKYKSKEITLRRFIFKFLGLIKEKYFKRKKKLNPLFDRYIDIENIKHYTNPFNEDDIVIITEKLHGTNARFGYLLKYSIFNGICETYEFCYGSHNVQLTKQREKAGFYNKDVYSQIVEKYQLESKVPKNIILYGEIFGKGVQDLTYGLDGLECRFFDAKNIEKGNYLDYNDFIKLCDKLDLPYVPILYHGKFSDKILKECTEGMSTIYPKQIREGCVIKPIKEEYSHSVGRKIFKSINPEYLLRKNGTEYK